ncbi:MAG: HD domain-containing protein [Desulfobacteraceae bacterium]|jgi:uncharacterized protein|nr:HD domain-containing protein [Desulfobacteraceae bacterium]
MNPKDILAEYYDRGSKTFEVLVAHGEQVMGKAFKAAGQVSDLKPDLNFIENAAMLHDIGILQTNSPGLGCGGKHPYICHGILGRSLLEKIGFSEYGLVCERHIGVGISADDVRRFKLPLPTRDMLPITLEEQLICYADSFFSKSGNNGQKAKEKTVKQILRGLKRYGTDKVQRFQSWVAMFE